MGNSLDLWRASIGLFNSKCIFNQRVKVSFSMAFIFYYMKYLHKWTCNNCKLISLTLKDLICSLFFKIVLILLLLEAGDIEMNPGPNIINKPLSILHSNNRSIRYTLYNFLTKIISYISINLGSYHTTQQFVS